MRVVVCKKGRDFVNLYVGVPWSNEVVLWRADTEVCLECIERIVGVFIKEFHAGDKRTVCG